MKNNISYTSKDILVLSDRDHVRLRTSIYLGNMTKQKTKIPLLLSNTFKIIEMEYVISAFRCVEEILGNSIDEFSQINISSKKLDIMYSDNIFTVSDNGRGVPVDKHETGKFTPEVVFSQLRSGKNFFNNKEIGVVGQNGVGSSCVAFCSTEFKVDITRDHKRYKQTFSNGCEKISKPSITSIDSNKTGTSISFTLDPTVFEDVSLPDELIHNRAIEIALTNPGVTVEYNTNKYKFKKGFDDIMKDISQNYFKFEKNNMEFYVIFDVNKNIDEEIFTWVNSSLLFDSGICNTQFLNAFVDKTINHLEKEAKKNKCEITKNDIRRHLLIIGNLKVSDPQYDSQAKTRLTGPTLKKEFVELVDEHWSLFARRNKDWLQSVMEYAMRRNHSSAIDNAKKEMEKNSKKKIAGLIDATSKNLFERQILVTEGESAKASITEARNPKTTAAFPLTGKINNVYGATVSQLMNMGKITDLLNAIGLIPGQRAVRSNLKYSKIVLSTDADPDGGAIFGLLVNLFYQFWPELFDAKYSPIIYRLVAPNVCLVKGDKRIHFPSRIEYEKVKDQYKGYTVNYFKGLGSMSKQDWEMILSGKTNTLIPIVDDGDMKKMLQLVFSADVDARKLWLQK